MMNFSNALSEWRVEDEAFWEATGKSIAQRNLYISIFCLFLSFATWFIWSAISVNLNNIGFNFTASQRFTLAAMPGLTGATLRIAYSFVVPIFGGRNWTVISTASLLVPVIGIGIAVQDPTTSYTTMLILAALCGLGGGNFSSSMSNISFFFPKKEKGTALGINAGLGNLGVSAVQFLAPAAMGLSMFGVLGGDTQTWVKDEITRQVWLQNVAFMWTIPIIIAVFLAFFGMHNLETMGASFKEQLVVLKRKHLYLTTWLYTASFGSFIGYSAAFPLLIEHELPHMDPLKYAFIGPLIGALVRPIGGWISDKLGGARVTFWCNLVMIGAVLGVIYFISPDTKNTLGFFLMFFLLFTTTGFLNGSIFRMMSVIFPPKEAAPVLGLSAAIAAYGAFYIPKVFGVSLSLSGSFVPALVAFIVFYVSSLVVTWWYYSRKNAEMQC